jgi:glutamyl-tRNA synthetase
VQFDRKAFEMLKARLASVAWERPAISEAIKEVVKSCGVKMPAVAMPLRVMLTGRPQTPSIDAVVELLGRDTVLLRLSRYLETE